MALAQQSNFRLGNDWLDLTYIDGVEVAKHYFTGTK